MEEILASIRRIIEDSEPSLDQPGRDTLGKQATEQIEDDHTSMLAQDPPEEEPATAHPSGDRSQPWKAHSMSTQASRFDLSEPVAGPLSRTDVEPLSKSDAGPLDGLADDFGTADGQQGGIGATSGDGEHTHARPGLVSDRSARKVKAAFDELSDVFVAAQRRDFNELAETMLRPMLQQWLDQNLPTLVEALVREEIERLAGRGTD